MTKKKYLQENHIMIDIETLDTKSSAVFVSVGACRFTTSTEEPIKDAFYERVDWASSFHVGGRTVSMDTIQWWFKQSNKARHEILQPGIILFECLKRLEAWISQFKNPVIWSAGSFDINILEDAFEDQRISVPWKYSNVRDFRTIRKLVGQFVEAPPNPNKHNALVDAIHQARYLVAMLDYLNIKLN
jgi:hypothetical protein